MDKYNLPIGCQKYLTIKANYDIIIIVNSFGELIKEQKLPSLFDSNQEGAKIGAYIVGAFVAKGLVSKDILSLKTESGEYSRRVVGRLILESLKNSKLPDLEWEVIEDDESYTKKV